MRKKPISPLSNLDRIVSQVLSSYAGQPIVFFADNHLIGDQVLDVAIATAKKLNKPIGLEIFKPAHQITIEHLKKGNLSRDEFVRLGFARDEQGKPLIGTPEYYMGYNRTKAMLEKIADNILEGVRFYPLGRTYGLEGAPHEFLQIYDRIELLRLRIQLSIHFSKATQNKIKDNPRQYWEDLFDRVTSSDEPVEGSEHITLSYKQRERLSEAFELDSSQDEDYLRSIQMVLEILHPDWNTLEEEEDKLRKILSNFPDEIEKSCNMDLATLGCRIDPYVAKKITLSDEFGEKGMVVVYGHAHSINFRGRLNPDIVTSLNNKGIPVLIADTELPKKYLDEVSASKNPLTQRIIIPLSPLTLAP